MSTPMIAMTTKSSTSVKPDNDPRRCVFNMCSLSEQVGRMKLVPSIGNDNWLEKISPQAKSYWLRWGLVNVGLKAIWNPAKKPATGPDWCRQCWRLRSGDDFRTPS